MNLNTMRIAAKNKNTFLTLQNFSDFAHYYLDYISNHLQAVIVARNETNYRFFQYNSEGNFAVTRPINSDLMLSSVRFEEAKNDFFSSLQDIRAIKENERLRANINNFIYTCQQSIGATLDSLPAGQSNSARKLNGDLFEHFIRLILEKIGVPVRAGIVQYLLSGRMRY